MKIVAKSITEEMNLISGLLFIELLIGEKLMSPRFLWNMVPIKKLKPIKDGKNILQL